MILVVDMNSKENPFGLYEFVQPIVAIAEELEKCRVKHYLDVDGKSLSGYDKIILSGSALKDTITLFVKNNSRKSVQQNCPTKVSNKSVKQKCQTKVSDKSVQ